jgi:hypothetical protein
VTRVDLEGARGDAVEEDIAEVWGALVNLRRTVEYMESQAPQQPAARR